MTIDDREEEELLSDEQLEDEKEEDNQPKESFPRPKSTDTKAVTERVRPVRRHQNPKHLTNYVL